MFTPNIILMGFCIYLVFVSGFVLGFQEEWLEKIGQEW